MKTCNKDGSPCSFPTCMPCDEVRGGLVPVKQKLPELDGVDEHYHIRRLNNCYRVYLHQPGWAAQRGAEYFYVGIERLHDDHWHQIPGTSETCTTRFYANERIIELYKKWRPA